MYNTTEQNLSGCSTCMQGLGWTVGVDLPSPLNVIVGNLAFTEAELTAFCPTKDLSGAEAYIKDPVISAKIIEIGVKNNVDVGTTKAEVYRMICNAMPVKASSGGSPTDANGSSGKSNTLLWIVGIGAVGLLALALNGKEKSKRRR